MAKRPKNTAALARRPASKARRTPAKVAPPDRGELADAAAAYAGASRAENT